MCLSVAWFLFASGNSVSSSDKSDVIYWYRLSSLGFAPFFALNLNFYLVYMLRTGFRPRYLFLYLPVPFIISGTFFSVTLFDSFIFTGSAWLFHPAYSSPWFWGYLIYYISYTLAAVAVILNEAFKSE